jgi:hypothetical protein
VPRRVLGRPSAVRDRAAYPRGAAHLSLQSKKGSASKPLNSIPKERGRNRYGSFEELSRKAKDQPGNLGVEIHTKTKVTQVEKEIKYGPAMSGRPGLKLPGWESVVQAILIGVKH